MPDDDAAPTEVCPGCGAVLAPAPGAGPAHPGASVSCTRLFEVTLRGLREEAAADAGVAAVVREADATYDLQHPVPPAGAPRAWRTTIADVAADLDVIDLAVLVGTWRRTVLEDAGAPRRDERYR
ncbi:hypothetical protein [Blastococcus sp. TF02A-30]|uniref:hypothetical protein n=1 Tax=Blastococcus sp. TF02A-30 TaxID=2250580 RepID=UPI0013143540|nr:hypothetical protein [Blastococcus sp. TF02A-30]